MTREHASGGMDNAVSSDIRERERINARLDGYWSLPEWTPAMGAMLISGVIPVPGCTEIPKSGLDLRSPEMPASARAVHEAERALERWNEYREDQTESDPSTANRTSLTPFEFLLWCQEDYEQVGDTWKPPWLRYWLSFTGMEIENGAPLPAPSPIVTRAAELEGFASVVRDKLAATPNVAGAAQTPQMSALTEKVIELIGREGRLTIKDLVVQVLKEVNDPRNPGGVWVRLCAMAESRAYPTLRYVDPTTLEIPYGATGWKKWRRTALTQYLGRHVRDAVQLVDAGE